MNLRTPSCRRTGLAVMKRSLRRRVVEIAVAAGAAHEGLPVVVEGLDAPGRRVVLAQGDDLAEVAVERVVQLAHRHVVPSLGSAENRDQARCHCSRVGGVEDGAELVDDLVGAARFPLKEKRRRRVARWSSSHFSRSARANASRAHAAHLRRPNDRCGRGALTSRWARSLAVVTAGPVTTATANSLFGVSPG